MKGPWTKRELIGERSLDKLSDGSTVLLKAFHKWWADGSECLKIMKYIRKPDGKEQSYHPVQHVQVVWTLAGPFLELFKKEGKVMDILTFYQKAKDLCIKSGFQDEIDWVEKRKLEDQNVTTFFGEYMYVVVNSGMKNAVAEGIYRRAIKAGMSAIGHPQKRKALQLGLKMKEQWWAEFKEKKTLEEQLAYLESLPWIGPITKYHLARNLGLDVAKPDRHMVRVAHHFEFPDIQKMCEYLSKETGDRTGTVDVILWRAMVLTNGKILEVENGRTHQDSS